jgi:hypothetical protein
MSAWAEVLQELGAARWRRRKEGRWPAGELCVGRLQGRPASSARATSMAGREARCGGGDAEEGRWLDRELRAGGLHGRLRSTARGCLHGLAGR